MYLPKHYAKVCEERGPAYFDYQSLDVKFGELHNYEIEEKVGRGKYSDVFKGCVIPSDDPVAIKILKPVKKDKIKRELKILKALSGTKHCNQLVDIVRDPGTKTVSLILKYVETYGKAFKLLAKSFTIDDVKHYFKQALTALNEAHSRGVMHRDIKSYNLLIDSEKRHLELIDWGLAEFYHPGKEYNLRVGNKTFKAPELLLGN